MCNLQGPLHKLTSRPAITHLQDMVAGNVELLRVMRLEHEAYGWLAVAFTTQVCSAPLAMPHLLCLPPISPPVQ